MRPYPVECPSKTRNDASLPFVPTNTQDVTIPELGPRPAHAELHGLVLPAASISAAAGSVPSRSAASRAYRNLGSPLHGSGGSVSMGPGGGGGAARSRLARATAVDPAAEGGSPPPPRRPGSGSHKGLRQGGSHNAIGSTAGSEIASGSPSVSGKGGGYSAGGLAAAGAATAAAYGVIGGPAYDGSALLPEQLSPLRRDTLPQQQQQQQRQQQPTRGAAEIVAASAFGEEHEDGHGGGGVGTGTGHDGLEPQGGKYRQLRVSLE